MTAENAVETEFLAAIVRLLSPNRPIDDLVNRMMRMVADEPDTKP